MVEVIRLRRSWGRGSSHGPGHGDHGIEKGLRVVGHGDHGDHVVGGGGHGDHVVGGGGHGCVVGAGMRIVGIGHSVGTNLGERTLLRFLSVSTPRRSDRIRSSAFCLNVGTPVEDG